MSKTYFHVLLLAFLVLVAMPLAAQENYIKEIEDPTAAGKILQKTGIGPLSGFIPGPELDPKAEWKEMWICRSGGPAEVQGFEVQCDGASFLDFHVADCCIDGDHWQLKGKNWDAAPNTGVTTAPGPSNLWSVPGRVYNYSGTPSNPRHLNAYVECTYPHGVDVFLADSFVNFSSDGQCRVTPDTARRRIDRTP